MFQEIAVQRLSAGSIFKLVAIGTSVTFIPFSVLMGCFALFGANTVTWNNESIHGITGLLASPFIGIFISLIFTLFLGSFIALGLWVFSKFRPITLLVKQNNASIGGS